MEGAPALWPIRKLQHIFKFPRTLDQPFEEARGPARRERLITPAQFRRGHAPPRSPRTGWSAGPERPRIQAGPDKTIAPTLRRASGRSRANPDSLMSWIARKTGPPTRANKVAHRIGPSGGEPRRPCRTGLAGKYAQAKKTVMDDARDTRTAPLKKGDRNARRSRRKGAY